MTRRWPGDLEPFTIVITPDPLVAFPEDDEEPWGDEDEDDEDEEDEEDDEDEEPEWIV